MEEENNNNRSCLPPAESAPWLVYTHGNGRRKKFQTFCTVSSQHYFKSIPQLRGKIIISSNDGWLILNDFDNIKMFTLWNPTSLQTIHLPLLSLLEDEVYISCAFVCPPPPEDGDDRDVSVFIFVNGTAFSCRPHNNNTWIAHTTDLLGQRAEVQEAIICNGVIYGCVYIPSEPELELERPVISEYYYVIIEVNNGVLTLRSLGVEVPEPSFLYTDSRLHLLASCGQVYVVRVFSRYLYKRICGVSIWELDLRLMKWVQVKCLGDRTFLVGEINSNTWCWGSIHNNELGGVKRNSVYIEVSSRNLNGVPKALYLYNLEDESLTTFLPSPNIPSFFEHPIWIMPKYHRLGKNDNYTRCTGKVGLLKQGLQANLRWLTSCSFLFIRDLCILVLTSCSSVQPQNEERTLIHKSESSQISDALSLTFDKQKHNDEFLLCELPPDLIATVATHMHLFDYINFRATCKEFSCIPPMARYPLLMFFESEEPGCTLMDPFRGDSRYIVIPELFRGAIFIDSSKDGWLLLRTQAGDSLHFFNLFTGVSGEYPPCEFLYDVSSVGFSTCPISPDCVTVGVAWFTAEYAQIVYHCFNEKTWHECYAEYNFGVVFQSVLSPVYHKGVFYFLDIRGYLGVFQLVNEDGTCNWDVFGKPQIPNGEPQTPDGSTCPRYSSYLVECGEELLSVFIEDMGTWVRVFRLDQRKRKWTRVRSLGNHILFVGASSSFSVVAKEREMANRIYLPRTLENGLLYYALDTGKYSTHTTDESFEDFTGTKEHIRCSWI